MLQRDQIINLLKLNLNRLKKEREKGYLKYSRSDEAILFGRVEALLGILKGFDYTKSIHEYREEEEISTLFRKIKVKEHATKTLIKLTEKFLENES
jgi:hypothetical protein